MFTEDMIRLLEHLRAQKMDEQENMVTPKEEPEDKAIKSEVDKTKAKDDAETFNMEDIPDADIEKAKKGTLKKDNPTAEVKDKELKQIYSSRKSSIYLCNECCKTFVVKDLKESCPKCGKKNIEMLVEADSSMVPTYKHVFAVKYKDGDTEEETRMEAFDESDARNMTSKGHSGRKILSVNKISENKEPPFTIEGYLGKGQIDILWSGNTYGDAMDAFSELSDETKSKYKFVNIIDNTDDIGEAKDERGKRDGTGPYKDSYQKKDKAVGKRKEAGETCPNESKVDEQTEDNYTTVAKGISDKVSAEKLAKEQDGQVVADEQDEKKFMVIKKAE